MVRQTIAVADPIHAAGLERLRSTYDVAFLPGIAAPETRANAIAAAEAIVVRVFRIDEALLSGAPRRAWGCSTSFDETIRCRSACTACRRRRA